MKHAHVSVVFDLHARGNPGLHDEVLQGTGYTIALRGGGNDSWASSQGQAQRTGSAGVPELLIALRANNLRL